MIDTGLRAAILLIAFTLVPLGSILIYLWLKPGEKPPTPANKDDRIRYLEGLLDQQAVTIQRQAQSIRLLRMASKQKNQRIITLERLLGHESIREGRWVEKRCRWN